MYYEGTSGVFMSNAWIDGVWPSMETPYKMGRPAGLRGTITQDRGAGIMGVDGKMSPEAADQCHRHLPRRRVQQGGYVDCRAAERRHQLDELELPRPGADGGVSRCSSRV